MHSVHCLRTAASSGASAKVCGEPQGETGRGLGRQGGGDAADGVRHWKAAEWGRRSGSGTSFRERSLFDADQVSCASCIDKRGEYVLGQREESEGREARGQEAERQNVDFNRLKESKKVGKKRTHKHTKSLQIVFLKN